MFPKFWTKDFAKKRGFERRRLFEIRRIVVPRFNLCGLCQDFHILGCADAACGNMGIIWWCKPQRREGKVGILKFDQNNGNFVCTPVLSSYLRNLELVRFSPSGRATCPPTLPKKTVNRSRRFAKLPIWLFLPTGIGALVAPLVNSKALKVPWRVLVPMVALLGPIEAPGDLSSSL